MGSTSKGFGVVPRGRSGVVAEKHGEDTFEQLLTPAEVARMFRVSPKTVTRWSRAGKIRAVRTLGGHRRFYRAEIERAIEAGETGRMNSSGR